MPRLIDADALQEQVKAIHAAVDTVEANVAYDTGFHSATSQIQGLIEYMPTVDPESRRPHGRWVPVEEKLPDKDHDWVLVACEFVPEGGYGVPHVAELRNGVWYADCYDIPLEDAWVKVTHWMPLPDSPNCGAKMDLEE